jgi:transposase
LSTKILALVDAPGNPIGFFLTGGEAHDLEGADRLLSTMAADTLIADEAFDADARVLEPLAAAGKTAVIPPRTNRSSPRDYDRQL